MLKEHLSTAKMLGTSLSVSRTSGSQFWSDQPSVAYKFENGKLAQSPSWFLRIYQFLGVLEATYLLIWDCVKVTKFSIFILPQTRYWFWRLKCYKKEVSFLNAGVLVGCRWREPYSAPLSCCQLQTSPSHPLPGSLSALSVTLCCTSFIHTTYDWTLTNYTCSAFTFPNRFFISQH